ncbi:type VI secretion system TssO [uncultured Maribacter sp.]|uniref:type VI secretion system TssO n=1 Tax=uncultured Maribacter sp. TaxID=431308 RepID=UPI00262A77B2|nr:type VI secretion system TssO [uncultured Maribacter sp.]
MKAKNEKERNKSFLKFMALFVVTTLLIMGAVFLNYRVPHKENELLRERAKLIEQETEFQRGFAAEIKGTRNLLDSLDLKGQNISYLNDLISQKLVGIQGSLPAKDSTFKYTMYKNILDILVDYQKSKKELNALSDAKNQIEEFQTELEKTQQELEQAKRDLDILRVSRRR